MKKTILLVEDEQNILNLLKAVFEDDYNVVLAGNGTEALQVLTTIKPDLILLDIMMDGKMNDGFDTLKAIKQNDDLKDIKVFMLSAKCHKKDMDEAESLGADRFITKPFDCGQLLDIVNSTLN